MTDEHRHERRNARGAYATGDLGLWIRDLRQRFLPTENGHAALPSETGATCGYQSDSSSKRPVSSVTLASRRPKGALPFLRPKPLSRLSAEAKERKHTMKNQVREPCRLTLDAGRSISGPRRESGKSQTAAWLGKPSPRHRMRFGRSV
jgi:hypothetical protein